jgi:hypothetical protein
MRKMVLAALAGVALISCNGLSGALADEAPIVRSKKVRAACHGSHCGGPYSSCLGGHCRTVCPYAHGEARYAPCYSLYGAYGPIGGSGYWGAYTFSGWGPGW